MTTQANEMQQEQDMPPVPAEHSVRRLTRETVGKRSTEALAVGDVSKISIGGRVAHVTTEKQSVAL